MEQTRTIIAEMPLDKIEKVKATFWEALFVQARTEKDLPATRNASARGTKKKVDNKDFCKAH